MDFLSNLGLVLLTMVGYSVGRVLPGRKYNIAAELFDGLIIVILWVGALVSNFAGKWVSVLIWFGIGLLFGALITLMTCSKLSPAATNLPIQKKKNNFFKNIWEIWKAFAFRMGNFQSRLLLLLFYFAIVTPFGIIYRLFKDPLHLKKSSDNSFWFPLAAPEKNIDNARRQF